ncbi:MAG TPA: hypothetical protein PK641_04360, partial [Candidatus Enterocola sp.]|nr:hypothetical protein [Candidatus Enterocola sp.]
PSPFTFGTINRTSCTTANLAWSANAPALLVRYEGSSPSITNPTHGQSYSSGNTIGAGTVVYSGTSDNYTATFDADKIYTFVIYSVSASGYLYSTSASTTLPKGVPTVTTTAASSIDATSATLGGNVTAQGVGGAMSNRGIEWTLTVGGKTAGDKEIISTENATGAFSKEFTGLTGSTTYKYKAYATNNSCETSYGYGSEVEFTTSATCSTPSSGFAASGTYNSGNWTTRFANDYRTASLSTNQVADAYLWECTSANSSKVSIASNTSKTTNATFDLPGEYTFRVGAKCTSDGGYTYSETVTVNVPYPDMGISGPFYDGNWDHPKAGTDGKFTRNGLVYTKDFTVNTSNGGFVIIQAYKLGCESNSGWAGYQECNVDGKGNKINCSTLTTSTINTSSCGNFTQNAGLSNGQTARLTVTMTAYDSYTMSLGLACTPPTGGTATASASSVCSGSGTTITLTGNTGTIQWQSSTNGTDYSNISGQTSSTLSTGNLTVKTWYRAVLTSDGCTSNSSAAEVTIKTSPVLSAITGSATTTQYKPETYTASGSNLGTLTWAIVGAPAHANISATTGSSTVFKAKDGSYTLSVTATNDGCTDNETKGITVSTDSETCP